MDPVEAIRIGAMLDVMEGTDFFYQYRRVCRWYSETFHTPLHEVDELPTEFVLQAFFETQFEKMSPADRKKLALEMTETEVEKKGRKKAEKAKSDDVFMRKLAKKAAKDEAAAVEKFKKAAAEAAQKIAELADKEMLSPPKQADLPDISLAFPNDNLLEEESIRLPRK